MVDLIQIKTSLLSHTPILLYDGGKREDEIDMLFYPKKITYKQIQFLRTHAGGLICVSTSAELSDFLNIPFISEVLPEQYSSLKISKTPYGDKPAFSLSINHRKTFTGITDKDRAKTILEFYNTLESKNKEKFYNEFYSPGHVFLLRSAKSLQLRRGHTELSTFLCKKAGLLPIAVICEMLGEDGNALSIESAKVFAKENDFLLIDASKEKELFR
ncbi:MAG: 3,4-dihydroxy-2-butanone-4-phosphate synthase [Candidatus ainarchaeum sp.]|nr:3,4-dihydroxy-2-butanone-4-phosphate synthase [Candidatus ainarchaeum sp.]